MTQPEPTIDPQSTPDDVPVDHLEAAQMLVGYVKQHLSEASIPDNKRSYPELLANALAYEISSLRTYRS